MLMLSVLRVQAIDALTEVFIVALLPNRKLRAWSEQNLLSGPVTSKDDRRRLLYYHVEDCIKSRWAFLPLL